MKKMFTRLVAGYLVMAMCVMGMAPRVYAGMVSSEILTSTQTDRVAELTKIQKAMETKIIKERLKELGFTQKEIQARLDRLNDQQIHQLALGIDDLKVGGNGFEVLVVLLLIGIVVGVWVYATGHRVVVTK
ncbi:MAG: PA2779 family protein [Candidatus Desulfaltia sp.]|nr:PA2779 family protein [Candidatus Desulfaltia sp.]